LHGKRALLRSAAPGLVVLARLCVSASVCLPLCVCLCVSASVFVASIRLQYLSATMCLSLWWHQICCHSVVDISLPLSLSLSRSLVC